MKILWLINIVLPIVAEAHNEKITNSGGWLVSLSKILPEKHKLVICYPYRENCSDSINDVIYYGCVDCDADAFVAKMRQRYEEILEKEQPDLIHIWGTEHLHSYAMTEAAKTKGIQDRVVVSIQGMVDYYHKHFMASIPWNVQVIPSIRDIIRKDSLIDQQKNMKWRGNYECKCIRNVKHVIGRTTWDRICTKLINPTVEYHFNNEILRPSFYQKRWSVSACDRYSIFVSQAQMPIKGFHFVLEALDLLKEKYPEIHVFVAGSRSPFEKGIKATAYSKYLRQFAEKKRLLERVTYLGSLDEEAMCDRFAKSHVFVSASSIENSPNSVGEAMLLGMPVVASNVGGTFDLLEDKKEGFLYQYDAPYMLAGYIDLIFSDDELASTIGENAFIHANKTHAVDNNFEVLLEIYNSISECALAL